MGERGSRVTGVPVHIPCTNIGLCKQCGIWHQSIHRAEAREGGYRRRKDREEETLSN